MTELFTLRGAYAFGMTDIYEIRRQNLNYVLSLPRLARMKHEKNRAAFFGLSPSMWSQVRHPDYKIGDEMAARITDALKRPRGWLDSEQGKHEARSDGVKILGAEVLTSSQNETLDALILATAELWVRMEEGAGRTFQPMRRLHRLMEIVGMIQADGGALTPEHSQELIDAARRGDWDDG